MMKKLMAASALAVGGVGLSPGVAAPAFADTNGAATGVFPISFPALNICNFDFVVLSGSVHFTEQAVSNDETVHDFAFHDAVHVSGTAPDGTRYVGNGGDVGNVNIAAGQTVSDVRQFTLISQGSDPNLTFSEREHITIDANGNVTVSFDNLDLECFA